MVSNGLFRHKRLAASALALTMAMVAPASALPDPPVGVTTAPHVLVFSATYGFRHPVIPKSNLAMYMMGAGTGAYNVDISENPADISAANLANYDAVVFNSTAGKTPLTAQQRSEFIRFMACGGGFVGIAMAADSNYAWPEYTELLGANVVTHPLTENHTPKTRTVVTDPDHPITAPSFGKRRSVMTQEELYTWRMDPRRLPSVHTLLHLDTKSISKQIQNGPDYFPNGAPAAWTSIFRGKGRSYYNGFGHGELSWNEPWFRSMVHEGIKWVLGPTGHPVDRACASGSQPLPPPNGPKAARAKTIGKACAIPKAGHYKPNLKRLLPKELTTVMPVGVPLTIFAPNLRYVLDLSSVKARSADIELTMTWTPPADYDLGITTEWGFAGSSLSPPLDTVGGERVVLKNVPHCSDFLVAAENFWGAGLIAEALRPTLTIKVTPRR